MGIFHYPRKIRKRFEILQPMKNTFDDKAFQEKLEKFAPEAELMPSVVIVQQIEPFKSLFMTSRGLKELGITSKELTEIGSDYIHRFFNIEDSEDYLEKLKKLLYLNNPDESFTFFQQVKFKDRNDWVWHIGSTRIFFKDHSGNPTHLVTIAIPIEGLKHIPNKAERILLEKNFFHTNYDKFNSLGNREKEILKCVALGQSSHEIAAALFISVETVHTHRKSIKRKLGIFSSYDFSMYAHAYDLI